MSLETWIMLSACDGHDTWIVNMVSNDLLRGSLDWTAVNKPLGVLGSTLEHTLSLGRLKWIL